jgi:hypothetical protein
MALPENNRGEFVLFTDEKLPSQCEAKSNALSDGFKNLQCENFSSGGNQATVCNWSSSRILQLDAEINAQAWCDDPPWIGRDAAAKSF